MFSVGTTPFSSTVVSQPVTSSSSAMSSDSPTVTINSTITAETSSGGSVSNTTPGAIFATTNELKKTTRQIQAVLGLSKVLQQQLAQHLLRMFLQMQPQ